MQTLRSVMLLMLALQSHGQAQMYGQQEPMYGQQAPMYSQMVPQGHMQQQAPLMGQGLAPQRQPQPLPQEEAEKPLPSRTEILEEKDMHLKESRDNVAIAMARLVQETESKREEIEAATKKSKEEYLVILEETAKKRLQEMEEHLATRKREIMEAGETYQARLEQQAQDLLARAHYQELHSNHQHALAAVSEEEILSKEELEQQIRSVYDAVRSGYKADPRPGIEVAKERFAGQIAELGRKRQDLDVQLQQQLQEFASSPTIWN